MKLREVYEGMRVISSDNTNTPGTLRKVGGFWIVDWDDGVIGDTFYSTGSKDFGVVGYTPDKPVTRIR